jgi:predicted MFS family arabinose efflux permease
MLVPEGLRGRALAVVMGGLTVATAVGVPLGTAVAAGAGWRGAFWVIAGFGAAAALALNRLLPTVSSPPVASLRTRAAVAARAPVLVSLLITFLALGGGFTMYSYIAVVLAHTAGAHDAGLSVLLLVLGISSAAGNALSGHLVDRWGATPVLALALTLMATVFAVFGVDLVSNAALTVPWIVLWGVGAWLSVPALQHRVAANAPDLPVVALSLNASALYGGIAVGGLLGGAVISHGSAVDLGIAAAVLEAAGLGVLVLANRFATRTREASRAPATAAEPTRADAA